MAKRFTDTLIWEKEWFMKLSPKHKCLIRYLFDRCDASGVWEQNWTLASIYIGEPCNLSDLMVLDTHLDRLPNGKILIKDFISFQYGKLSEKCAAHIPIFKAIEKNKLCLDRVSNRVYYTLQEKETETEEEKEEETEVPAQEEKFSDSWFKDIFDDILVESIRSTFPKHDLENEFKIFRLKVRGSPKDYEHRDTGGIRQAFIYQLKNSKHDNGKSNQQTSRRADAVIETGKDFGKF